MSEELKEEDAIYVITLPGVDIAQAMEAIIAISVGDYYEEGLIVQGFSYKVQTQTLTVFVEHEILKEN